MIFFNDIFIHMRKKIYITSTLKSEWNRTFNSLLCNKLEKIGITCHLPQRDTKQDGTDLDKFSQNIEGIKNSDQILAVGMNESINWWLEVGYGFGSEKKIILLTNKEHSTPIMSLEMYYKILRVDNLDDMDEYIDDLVRIIRE